MEFSGEYGGCVKRTFSGDGKKWIAGAVLNPSDVMHWPLANRMALHKEGKVDWYAPPKEAEENARQQGKPVAARGKVAKPETTAPKANPASSRRTRTAP